MIKRSPLIALMWVCLASLSQAAIVQNFSGTIDPLDLDNDSKDDLTIAVQEFEVTTAGEVSVAGSVVGIQWFLMLFDDAGTNIQIAHIGAPTVTLDLDVGSYQFAIGAMIFGESDLDLDAGVGFDSNKTLADVGFSGNATSVGWNVTVVSPGTEVPLPAALPLFASSLLGLLVMRRRRH